MGDETAQQGSGEGGGRHGMVMGAELIWKDLEI